MADPTKIIKGGLSAVRNASRAADQAMEAQRLAREAANPPIKASEAYGKHEGAYMKPIFYDRMKVDLSKGKLGGPGFSGIQLVDPNYAEAKAVAGVTDKKMATRILNRNTALVPKGADVIWTPSVGGLEQHKSNSTMFGEFADIFANQRKNMSNDEIQKLSDYASNKVDNNGRLIFPNGIDLGSRNFRQQVKTYDQRSLMADIFAGRGVGGEKGRTVPVEELLEKNLDPNMAQAGTLDLGNRLFRLEGNVIDRPDLHTDYRMILTGDDLDVNYLPVPIKDVYSGWEANKLRELAAQGKNRPVMMMDYTKNDPTVQLTEELLTKLQKAGKKDGGVIDSDQELKAMIADHLEGQRDDPKLRSMIEGYMAGGEVKGFKKLNFMADDGVHMVDGGKIAKGMMGAIQKASKFAESSMAAKGTRKFEDGAGGLNIMKEPSGNWVSGEVEKALKPLKKPMSASSKQDMEKLIQGLMQDPPSEARERFVRANQQTLDSVIRTEALNKWVDSNLTNYVKKQMATENDPVRKLAEEGIIHYPVTDVATIQRYGAPEKRAKLGQPQLGKSEIAKAWEDASDVAINPLSVSALKTAKDSKGVGSNLYESWMEKADPSATVNTVNLRFGPSDLGFDHIMDVLKIDLEAGRIRPEQLNKVSMEQAVRRAHEYDQEMAKRMREAHIKATEGMPTHKEYPEGYKWIELSQPKDLPKGWTQEPSGAYISPTGERTIVNPSRQLLDDSLKYEGDTMGHCVGSYCDDVAGGKSRIYSLRDAKGEPHVTIETEPNPNPYPVSGDAFAKLTPTQKAEYREHVMQWRRRNPDVEELTDEHTAQALKEAGVPPQPDRIVQIKGKSNRAPNEEYLPFVQDFVKSGNWSEVGDLSNTGLKPYKGNSGMKYVTPEEYEIELRKELGLLPPAEGMAEGGGAFKTLQWSQRFDNGGIASPEESSTPPPEGDQTYAGLMAEYLAQAAKDQGRQELSSLKKPRAVTDLINRGVLANNPLSAIIDMVNMGLLPLDVLGSKLTGRDIRVSSEKPFLGSEHLKDLMNKYNVTSGEERPMMETGLSFASPVGMIKGAQKTADLAKKAPEMVRKAESGLNEMRPAVQRPFTPATFPVEATAPDLGQGTSYGFRQGLNDRLLANPKLGTGKTKAREGQGTYVNTKGELELNPLQAIDVPRAGNIGEGPKANRALRQQVAQMGVDLNQEAMAGHRFLPMMTNNIKDASAMLIKTKEGLSKDQIADLARVLGSDMVVSHNPKLGGVVVFPFGPVTKGQIPEEFLTAQSAASKVLGKDAKIQYGKSDFAKDRLFMDRSEYPDAGAVPMSAEQQALRGSLQGIEKFMFPESVSGIPGSVKASPMGGLQSWSRGVNYPTSVVGIGNREKVEYQPVNFLTSAEGKRYPSYREADEERAKMLDSWHRTLPAKAR